MEGESGPAGAGSVFADLANHLAARARKAKRGGGLGGGRKDQAFVQPANNLHSAELQRVEIFKRRQGHGTPRRLQPDNGATGTGQPDESVHQASIVTGINACADKESDRFLSLQHRGMPNRVAGDSLGFQKIRRCLFGVVQMQIPGFDLVFPARPRAGGKDPDHRPSLRRVRASHADGQLGPKRHTIFHRRHAQFEAMRECPSVVRGDGGLAALECAFSVGQTPAERAPLSSHIGNPDPRHHLAPPKDVAGDEESERGLGGTGRPGHMDQCDQQPRCWLEPA